MDQMCNFFFISESHEHSPHNVTSQIMYFILVTFVVEIMMVKEMTF